MGVFHFKQFAVDDSGCGMKICSDSVLLGAWFAGEYPSAKRIADIGTGSGVIALICAQYCPDAFIQAIEIDNQAANVAQNNFKKSNWANRLNVLEGSFENFESIEEQNLIISNPPYFTNGEKSGDNSRAQARHQDGLSYETLISFARRHLTPNGHLGLISPSEFENDIIFAAEIAGLKLRRICHIHSAPEKACKRIMWDFSLTDGPMARTSITLYTQERKPSPEYISFVDPLYTKI